MIHTIEWKAMGSRMLVAVESYEEIPALLEEVPGWFEEWEQTLSRFRPGSELSQLNRSAGEPFSASPVLWAVYQAAMEAEQSSAGLVTPTLLNELEQAGYVQSFVEPFAPTGRYGNNHGLDALSDPALSAVERTISLPEGKRLDFGGLGKGWAAHQAMRRLGRIGPALVDAGGDISISGPRTGRLPWPVGVENPFAPGSDLTILQLYQCGVATSGRDFHRWQQNGRWMHHIIDPRTGLPADTDVLTATVIAPDVIQAEVAAKSVLILGSQQGIEWLQARPNLAGLLVLEDAGYIYTRNFEGYLTDQSNFIKTEPV
jgi:thiamine biosynthesis lipoprotein